MRGIGKYVLPHLIIRRSMCGNGKYVYICIAIAENYIYVWQRQVCIARAENPKMSYRGSVQLLSALHWNVEKYQKLNLVENIL